MRLAAFQHALQDAIVSPACAGDHANYRIAIHHSHFWTRMTDYAAYRYPLLARSLGQAAFAELVRAYIAAHPPTAYTAGAIVEGLQRFVEAPVLADLAAFDFARSALRAAAEEATLSAADLAAIPHMRLRLKRRTALISTRHRFDLLRVGELPREPEPTHWLVHITRGRCSSRRVDSRGFAALQRLAAGIALRDLDAELDGVLGACVAAELVVAEDMP